MRQLALVSLIGFCVACSDDGTSSTGGAGAAGGEGAAGGQGAAGGSGPTSVEGGVEKGPFVVGSSVLVTLLDASGEPTGDVITAQTSSDAGAFEFTAAAAGLVSIEASGFYFNEVAGDLSGAPLTLRAVADLASAPDAVFVNLITHLTQLRLAKLMEDGATFESARDQAEQELREQTGVGPAGFSPSANGNEISLLAGDDDGTAYALALGAVFLQAASEQAGEGGPVDATFQQLLSSTAAAFAETGVIPAPTVDALATAETNLDGAAVMTNLGERFAAIGSAADVPNIDRVLDPDHDDVANLDDNCPRTANSDQADADSNGVGDACECGNGVIDPGETCDDGNATTMDGCEPDCSASCEMIVELSADEEVRLARVFEVGSNVVLFVGGASVAGNVAYRIDPAGIASELHPTARAASSLSAAIFEGDLYFREFGQNLWRTDGTTAGTMDTQLLGGEQILNAGAYLYFDANGVIVRSDGTLAGSDTLAITGASRMTPFVDSLGDDVLFLRTSSTSELWRTNGAGVPTLVLDLQAPTDGQTPEWPLPVHDGDVMIHTTNPAQVRRVTGGGASTLVHAGPTIPYSVSAGGFYYFTTDGYSMMRTTGSSTATPVNVGHAHGVALGRFGDRVAVEASSEDFQERFMVFTDGTPAGTVTVGQGGPFYEQEPSEDHYFFKSADGLELWVTEGTVATTRRLSSLQEYGQIGRTSEHVYFPREEAGAGADIWRCKIQ